MALPATLDVEVRVSWDGSGDFDGPDDDVTGDVAIEPGVALDEGRDGAQSLSPPKIGAGDFALHNDDGRYSQERADSPVYQRVIPGRPVRYRASHGERRLYRSHTLYRDLVPYRGVGVWGLGRHLIDDISQTTDWGNRRVGLATLGYEAVLRRALVTVAVQANIRTDQAVTLLLDAAGWPADKRAISIGDTTLLYWWCDERAPWDAMLELLGAEGPGTQYVDRDGVFHWENRNYRTITPRSTTSQASFFDRDDSARTAYRDHVLYRAHRLYRGRTGGLWFTSLQYEPNFKGLYNRATYATTRRALAGVASVVWSYGTAFALTSGQSRTLIARPSDPFQNAVTPVLATDYTVAGGTVSVSLEATSGLVAFITVTATSGTPTVSALQLRAQPLTVVSETTVQNNVDASASIAKFSPIPGQDIPITLAVAGWPEIDPVAGEAVCDAWVTRYQVPRPLVTITIRNANAAHVRQILERMPSDRITLVEANTGLEADVWVNALQLRIAGAGGRVVELVLGCELTNELTGAVWDLSLWSDPSAVWGI